MFSYAGFSENARIPNFIALCFCLSGYLSSIEVHIVIVMVGRFSDQRA